MNDQSCEFCWGDCEECATEDDPVLAPENYGGLDSEWENYGGEEYVD